MDEGAAFFDAVLLSDLTRQKGYKGVRMVQKVGFCERKTLMLPEA